MAWNAERGILRVPDHEHTGIAPREAVRRIVALNAAAQASGITKNVTAHLAKLAPCLVALDMR